jgi:hypothetical protein
VLMFQEKLISLLQDSVKVMQNQLATWYMMRERDVHTMMKISAIVRKPRWSIL